MVSSKIDEKELQSQHNISRWIEPSALRFLLHTNYSFFSEDQNKRTVQEKKGTGMIWN